MRTDLLLKGKVKNVAPAVNRNILPVRIIVRAGNFFIMRLLVSGK